MAGEGCRRVTGGGGAGRPAAPLADPAAGCDVAGWRTGLVSRTSPAASTVRGYAAHVRLYLAPCLGQVLLADLSAAHVQAMFTAITRQHQELGSPVSAATLSRIRATLRAALNAAVRRGLITGNPASRAELPRARRPRAVVWTPARVEHWQRTGERPAVAVWTAVQTAQFLHAIAGHRLYAAFHLIALRGLRRGEAAGLRWCDVDLDGKTAVISQQLQQYDGRLEVCPPKTPHSVRVDRPGPHHGRGAAGAPRPAAGRGRQLRARLPPQRVRAHRPERRPDGPGPADPHLQDTRGGGGPAAGAAA